MTPRHTVKTPPHEQARKPTAAFRGGLTDGKRSASTTIAFANGSQYSEPVRGPDDDIGDDALAVYLRHRPALIDAASSVVGRYAAEDVVQDAWLRFSASNQPKQHPAAFLFRVVRNLAIDRGRRARREITGDGADEVLRSTAAVAPSVEQRLADSDDLRMVAEALAELPPAARTAFELHRFEGQTYAQIARALGVSQGQAHKLVQKAIVLCLERLEVGPHNRQDRPTPRA